MKLLLAAICASLLLLAGCSDGDEPGVVDSAVESPSTAEAAVEAADDATDEVPESFGTDPVDDPDGPTEERDSAANSIQRGELTFEPGAISGVVAGTVRGYDGEVWTFEAEGGQTAELDLSSESNFIQAVVRDPSGSVILTRSPGDPVEVIVLPQSGVFDIAVFLVRAEARRGGLANYDATLTLYPS